MPKMPKKCRKNAEKLKIPEEVRGKKFVCVLVGQKKLLIFNFLKTDLVCTKN
jgi:hypothetical protein